MFLLFYFYFLFKKYVRRKIKYLNKLNLYFVEEIFQFFESLNLGNDNVAFPIKHN